MFVSAIFYQIFIFSPNDSPSKIMKNVFISLKKLFSLQRYSHFCEEQKFVKKIADTSFKLFPLHQFVMTLMATQEDHWHQPLPNLNALYEPPNYFLTKKQLAWMNAQHDINSKTTSQLAQEVYFQIFLNLRTISATSGISIKECFNLPWISFNAAYIATFTF